jgi:hypothetical protein
MTLKAMDKSAVRAIAGARGFFVKQTESMLMCHGGIEEVDIALKHGIQAPQLINLILCDRGIEIKAIASGKVIVAAISRPDIVSIKFHGGIQPSGSMAGVATSAIVGSFVAGSVGALAGAAVGLNNATSGRICYAIEYKSGSKNEFLLVSFLPVWKTKIDKLFSNAYPGIFNPSMTADTIQRTGSRKENGSVETWKCPKCNNTNPNDSYTCLSCGYELI